MTEVVIKMIKFLLFGCCSIIVAFLLIGFFCWMAVLFEKFMDKIGEIK